MVRQPVAEKRHLSIIAGSSNSHLHQLWNLIRYAVIRHKDQKHYSAPTETDQETLISNRPSRYKIRQPSSSHLTPLTLFFSFQHGWLSRCHSVSPISLEHQQIQHGSHPHSLNALKTGSKPDIPLTKHSGPIISTRQPKQRGPRYLLHSFNDWSATCGFVRVCVLGGGGWERSVWEGYQL